MFSSNSFKDLGLTFIFESFLTVFGKACYIIIHFTYSTCGCLLSPDHLLSRLSMLQHVFWHFCQETDGCYFVNIFPVFHFILLVYLYFSSSNTLFVTIFIQYKQNRMQFEVICCGIVSISLFACDFCGYLVVLILYEFWCMFLFLKRMSLEF